MRAWNTGCLYGVVDSLDRVYVCEEGVMEMRVFVLETFREAVLEGGVGFGGTRGDVVYTTQFLLYRCAAALSSVRYISLKESQSRKCHNLCPSKPCELLQRREPCESKAVMRRSVRPRRDTPPRTGR